MKTRKYILIALAALLTASCMDGDWDDEVNTTAGEESYGNQYIEATNVVTVADLRAQYKNAIAPSNNSADPIAEIKKPTQISVVVTGNDIGGNLYNQIAVADETGPILIDIYQSGLYGFLPVGQRILVELQGLSIGGYGKQAQIGMPYNNGSYTRPSRMSRYEWSLHYKIERAYGGSALATVTPKVISSINELNIDNDCGLLITLKGVELSAADGKTVFAPSDGSVTATGGAINRAFKGINSNTLVLRTSTFADFANMVMPTGKVDVTGIATRFNNTWQILMRDENDITPAQ